MSCIPDSIVNMVLCFWEKSTIKGGYFLHAFDKVYHWI